MGHSHIDIPKETLAAFCTRNCIRRLSLFGSVLRDDFRPDSDVDVLVEFAPGEIENEEIHMHAPLYAVIRFGKRTGERQIPVKLGARLTEIGTLEIWAESKISEHRWRLQFELRKRAAEADVARRPAAVISEEAVDKAKREIGARRRERDDDLWRPAVLHPERHFP